MDLNKLEFCPVIPVIKKKYDKKYEKCLDCGKNASFNIEGETKRLYCAKHKKENMINNNQKNCLDCKKKPCFNVEGETIGIYCDKHKKNGMINVESPKCLECKSRPSYNVEGETTPIYCAKHKKENMVNVVSPTCLKCKSRPCFNVKGEKTGIYCTKHKKENMVDVVSPTCKTHLCSTRVKNEKYEGYCLRCFIRLFPDKQVVRNHKTKEIAVAEFVKNTFPDKKWVEDKRITGGSSKRRPDLLLDLCKKVIITDIDENQHKRYDENDDKNRIEEILQDVGNKQVIFIRFNPDEYIDKDNKKIKSCWSTKRKTGLVEINNKKKWEERLNVLKNKIQYFIDNKTENQVETVYLFYDEN